jgi:hypothetical protein
MYRARAANAYAVSVFRAGQLKQIRLDLQQRLVSRSLKIECKS